SGTRDVVAAYWAAAEARNWDVFGALVADDVFYELPQTGERVQGREAYVRFNSEGFPGEWHVIIDRIVVGERDAVSLVRFTDTNGSQTGLCFFELDHDGLITSIRDFWPEPYAPPAERARLVERY